MSDLELKKRVEAIEKEKRDRFWNQEVPFVGLTIWQFLALSWFMFLFICGFLLGWLIGVLLY